jgi:protein SCO1
MRRPISALLPFAALAALAVSGAVHAQVALDNLDLIEGVGIEQRIGEQVPLDARFQDQDGRELTIGQLLEPGRPLLLTLNYSNCPGLCIAQFESVLAMLNGMTWNLGEEFALATLSIDPAEAPSRAKRTQELYGERLARPEYGSNWTFLVGQEEHIRAVADAVGFSYKLDPATGEFVHDSALIVLTPSGVVSRYLGGMIYDPMAVRFALVEASEGQLGTIIDRVRMLCFSYDPDSNSYVLQARRIMMIGGAITATLLGGFLLFLWRFSGRSGKSQGGPRTISPSRSTTA